MYMLHVTSIWIAESSVKSTQTVQERMRKHVTTWLYSKESEQASVLLTVVDRTTGLYEKPSKKGRENVLLQWFYSKESVHVTVRLTVSTVLGGMRTVLKEGQEKAKNAFSLLILFNVGFLLIWSLFWAF